MKLFSEFQQPLTNADNARAQRSALPPMVILKDILHLENGTVYSIEKQHLLECFRDESSVNHWEHLEDKLITWIAFVERSRSIFQFLHENVYYFYQDVT